MDGSVALLFKARLDSLVLAGERQHGQLAKWLQAPLATGRLMSHSF